MTTTTELKDVTSTELHALWGICEAHAQWNPEVALILEKWTTYVLARRERFGK